MPVMCRFTLRETHELIRTSTLDFLHVLMEIIGHINELPGFSNMIHASIYILHFTLIH